MPWSDAQQDLSPNRYLLVNTSSPSPVFPSRIKLFTPAHSLIPCLLAKGRTAPLSLTVNPSHSLSASQKLVSSTASHQSPSRHAAPYPPHAGSAHSSYALDYSSSSDAHASASSARRPHSHWHTQKNILPSSSDPQSWPHHSPHARSSSAQKPGPRYAASPRPPAYPKYAKAASLLAHATGSPVAAPPPPTSTRS